MAKPANETERKLRDALERAQKELTASELRLRALNVEGQKQEALVRASFGPIELEAKAARERFDKLKAQTNREAQELRAAWKHEVELRELEIQRLQLALHSTGPSKDGGEHCMKCGSTKLIPAVAILDQGQHSKGVLLTKIEADPNAFFDREPVYSTLQARICGACGYSEIFAPYASKLYDAYVQSLES
jgi:hypothetical protein